MSTHQGTHTHAQELGICMALGECVCVSVRDDRRTDELNYKMASEGARKSKNVYRKQVKKKDTHARTEMAEVHE